MPKLLIKQLACLPLCFVLLLHTRQVHAELTIEIADPQWTFALENTPLVETTARIKPEEREFADKIKPLLQNGDYRAVAAAFVSRPLHKDSAALQVLRGQVLLATQQYAPAQAALEAALTEMPNLALAHNNLSLLHMMQENYGKAREHLTRAIELGAADAQIYGQLAFINLQTSHAASAVAGYQQALLLEPNSTQWRQGLLFALLNANALDQAGALTDELLLTEHNDSKLWLARSQVALQKQQYDKALASLEAALRLDDVQPQNRVTAALLHVKHGSIDRAVDLLSDAMIDINSNNVDSILGSAAEVLDWLIAEQQWVAVSDLLRRFEKLDETMPPTLQTRFDIYRAREALNNDQLTRARRILTATLDSDPTAGDALLLLADVYRRQKQLEQAVLVYQRAESLDKFTERALLARAQLEVDRGGYSEALAALRRVVEINPRRHDLNQNIRSLEQVVRNQE